MKCYIYDYLYVYLKSLDNYIYNIAFMIYDENLL